MRKGAAGSVRIPSSAKRVGSTFADYLFSCLSVAAEGLFVFRLSLE